MNINEQMHQIGQMGAVGYQPSDSSIEDLIARTKRQRTVRQGTNTLVGSVAAVAIGALGVQLVSAAGNLDDPAFQNGQNLQDKGAFTRIDDFSLFDRNQNGDSQGASDLGKISDDLAVAAQAAAALKALKTKEQQAADAAAAAAAAQLKAAQEAAAAKAKADQEAADAKAKADQEAADAKAAAELAQCKSDYPYSKYEYKYKDCDKNEWVIKDGWFKDGYANEYVRCDDQYSYTGFYFDCDKNSWAPKSGYFQFGNEHFYKVITWTDAATGKTRSGNWSGTEWGWEKKAIVSSGGYSYNYKYLGSNASWSGSTCTGVTAEKYGAPFRLSCLNNSDHGLNNGSPKVDNEWILQDNRYKWHAELVQYYCIDNPPEGWEWSGSAWVETTY